MLPAGNMTNDTAYYIGSVLATFQPMLTRRNMVLSRPVNKRFPAVHRHRYRHARGPKLPNAPRPVKGQQGETMVREDGSVRRKKSLAFGPLGLVLLRWGR